MEITVPGGAFGGTFERRAVGWASEQGPGTGVEGAGTGCGGAMFCGIGGPSSAEAEE